MEENVQYVNTNIKHMDKVQQYQNMKKHKQPIHQNINVHIVDVQKQF